MLHGFLRSIKAGEKVCSGKEHPTSEIQGKHVLLKATTLLPAEQAADVHRQSICTHFFTHRSMVRSCTWCSTTR